MRFSATRSLIPTLLACALVPIQGLDAQVGKPDINEKDNQPQQTQGSDVSTNVVPSSQPLEEKWEYKQYMSYAKSFPVKELNKLGADRWELVGFHHEREKGYYTLYIFKRKIK